MSEHRRRNREPLPTMAEKVSGGDETKQPPVLPMRLRKGIREALAGKHGRLRMDPEELAVLIGRAIDLEIELLARVREEHRQRKRTERMLAQPALFFAPTGRRGIWEDKINRQDHHGDTEGTEKRRL